MGGSTSMMEPDEEGSLALHIRGAPERALSFRREKAFRPASECHFRVKGQYEGPCEEVVKRLRGIARSSNPNWTIVGYHFSRPFFAC